MQITEYTYSEGADTANGVADVPRLKVEIEGSVITVGLYAIELTNDVLTIKMKDVLSAEDETTLNGLVGAHTGEPIGKPDEIRATDGRLIVRADSIPRGSHAVFTNEGDAPGSIGGGKSLFWDFSNSEDEVTAPTGYRMKRLIISFSESVYVKEGALYFYDAPKGAYIHLYVACPDGQYYQDRQGNPVQAVGDVPIYWFIRRHHFAGSCPMGDELNTEAAQESATPAGYRIVGEVYVPDTDNVSYGFATLELYRGRSVLLPGETL